MQETIESSSEVYPRKSCINYISSITSSIEMIVDVSDVLQAHKPTDSPNFEVNLSKDLITIFWINRNKDGRILNKQNQPTPTRLGRYIKINERLGEELGLYFGDGTKDDISCVEFANFSPPLIKRWLNHLREFGVRKTHCYFGVKVSENAKIKYGTTDGEVEKHWRHELRLPPNIKIRITWVPAKGKPSSYVQMYGTCVVRYFNSTFGLFYNSLLNAIPEFLEGHENFRIGFLRGIFAADGNINTRANGSLSIMRIAGDTDERKFIITFLERFFGIYAREDNSNQVYFWNIKNFRKIKELGIHKLHPKKMKSFDEGYAKLLVGLEREHDENIVLTNKTAISILEELGKHPMKTREIVRFANCSKKWVQDILNGYKCSLGYKYKGLADFGLVESSDNPTRRCEKLWKIMKKGKTFLKNSNPK